MPDRTPSSPPASPRCPTKRFEEGLAADGVGLRVLGVPHVTPVEGGILLMWDGEIIGAIGVSGMQSSQDAQVAQAGADALGQAPR
jgi:glc operon protein GlcG